MSNFNNFNVNTINCSMTRIALRYVASVYRHKFLKRLTEALFTQVWHLLYEKLKRDISLLLLLICGKLRFKAKKNADNFILIWFIIRLPFAKVNNNDNMVEYFFCCYSSRKKKYFFIFGRWRSVFREIY